MKVVVLTQNEDLAYRIERQVKTLSAVDSIAVITDLCKILLYFEKNSADAVLFDIDEEQTDWTDICSRIKYADKKIWLVLLGSNPYNAVQAFEAGASDFLFKPVGTEQLERTISKWKSSSNKKQRTILE